MARLNHKLTMAASHAVDKIVAASYLLAMHGWCRSEKREAGV